MENDKKIEILKEYLGHHSLKGLGVKFNVSQSYIYTLAKSMCKKYARTLAPDHPLRNNDRQIRRYEWREYAPEIIQHFSPGNDGLTPSQIFWKGLNMRAMTCLKHFLDIYEMSPADHATFEAQIILPLLNADPHSLLKLPNMGGKTLKVYADALCSAGYLDKPSDFKAYPLFLAESARSKSQEKAEHRHTRNKWIIKKFEYGISKAQIAREEGLSAQAVANILKDHE
jgi:hypothetical protein